jgi:hypothetical protein
MILPAPDLRFASSGMTNVQRWSYSVRAIKSFMISFVPP